MHHSLYAFILVILFALDSYGIDGFYMGVGTGVNQRSDSSISAAALPSSSFDYETGYLLNVSAGYTVDAYRFELEVLSSANKVKSITLGSDTANASGTTKTTAQFLNFYYDYPLADKWEVYGGLGVGYSRMRLDNIKNEDANVVIGNGDDSGVVYQIKFGSTFSLREHLQLILEARYLQHGSREYEDKASSQPFSIENDKQMALGIGLKYHFVME